MKTYACKKAISVSKKNIIVTMLHGNIAKTSNTLTLLAIVQEKPIKIFNKACPDIILAKSRMLKLKTFAI
jgi:hypothetical protein